MHDHVTNLKEGRHLIVPFASKYKIDTHTQRTRRESCPSFPSLSFLSSLTSRRRPSLEDKEAIPKMKTSHTLSQPQICIHTQVHAMYCRLLLLHHQQRHLPRALITSTTTRSRSRRRRPAVTPLHPHTPLPLSFTSSSCSQTHTHDDIRLIACLSPPHNIIGHKGQLPWDLPEVGMCGVCVYICVCV